MKRKHLFFKMVAVGVLLLIGMSAKATTTFAVGPGTYTGYAGTYTTIALAYAAVPATPTGGYVIELQSDYVTTVESYPIVLNARSGASSGNGITIQPKAGNTTTFTFSTSTATQLFKLDGAKWVTIDGLDRTKFILTNTVTAATAANAILITNDASNNTITNLTAKGQSTVAAASFGGVIQVSAGTTNTSGCDNNTISYCDVTGTSASTLPLLGISCYTATNKHDNLQVQYNNVYDINGTIGGGTAISISSGAATPTISYNKVYWTNGIELTSSKTLTGIGVSNGGTVTYNVVGYANNAGSADASNSIASSSSTTLFTGIAIGNSGTYTVSNNTVGGFNLAQGFAFNAFAVNTGASTSTISNNTVKDISMTTVGVGSGVNAFNISSNATQGALTFSGNTIRDISVQSSTHTISLRGFYAYNSISTNAYSFTGNTIYNLTSGSSIANGNLVAGIDVLNNTSTIEKNKIYNLKVNSTATSAAVYGIRLKYGKKWTASTSYAVSDIVLNGSISYRCTTAGTSAASPATGPSGTGTGIADGSTVKWSSYDAARTTTIKNNVIGLGGNVTCDASITGIELGDVITVNDVYNVYHNTVYIGGTSPASATKNTYAFTRNATSSIPTSNAVKNNIFANQRIIGGTELHCAMTDASRTLTTDYNIFQYNGKLSTTKTTFADWQGSPVTNDANSYNSDPKFVSTDATTPDLSINTGMLSDADAKGVSGTGVTDDYTGATRSGLTPTDIGAYSYVYTPVLSIPTVTTTAVSAITKTTATLGVTVNSDGNATVSQSGVVWSTSANPDINLTSKTIGGSGAITGLEAGTTYYVRAYATNSQGTGYGTELSFTTLAWTIAASVNGTNSNTGTITGAGDVATSATVTLTATATTGRFVSWTDGGAVVSLNKTYTFSATSNRTLVANFGNVYNTYYVRPSGSALWGNIGATADQIITATDAANNFNLSYLADNSVDGTATYYFAPGTYTFTGVASKGTQLTSGKIYGGFTGSELSIDPNTRVTSDLDGNGIVEPWELTNVVIITGKTGYKYADAGTADERIIRIDAEGEVNGVTITDFRMNNYTGAIAIGLPGAGNDNAGQQGTMKRCIVRKLKAASGIVQMMNSRSVVDQCLIEDSYGTTGVGAVYFNKFGGTLSNSVIRNNKATTYGGGVYGAATTTVDLKAVVKNCVIYNNTALQNGGGVRGDANSATLGGIEVVNSTIVNNTTGSGVASVELISNGLLVNSIVVNDPKDEIRANNASNYVDGVAYGSLASTNVLYPATNMATGKLYTDFNFVTPTTISGYVGIVGDAGFSQTDYDAVHAANFKINNAASVAVTTTAVTSIPSNYLVSGSGATINTYSSVPTTDIVGNDRTSSTLGAYQYYAPNTVEVTTQNPTLASLGLNTASNVIVTSSGSLSVDANKTVNSVTIAAGAKLDLGSANTLTVKDLVIESGKSVTESPSVNLTKAMNILSGGTVKLLKTIDASKWYFISFPCNVAISSIAQISTTGVGTLGNLGTNWWIKYYDGATRASNLGTASNWFEMTAGGTLEANKGYIIGLADALTGDHVLSFTLDKTLVEAAEIATTVPIGNYGEGSVADNHVGWNLVGSPYLSKFDGSGVGAKFLTFHNGSIYQPKLKTAIGRNINPFEAFFVQCNTFGLNITGTALTFSTDSRQLAKSMVETDLSDNVQLNFTTSTGTDNTTLIMDNNESPAYQINQDLEKWITLGTAYPQVYTVLGGVNFAFNALPMSNVNNLQIGYYTKTAGSTTISANASQAPGLSKLLLTDYGTNPVTVTDLLTSNYVFNTAAGTINNRFTISAQKISTINQVEKQSDELVLKTQNGKLMIENLNPNSDIRVFDALGKLLINKKSTSNVLTLNIQAEGIYSIQIQCGANVFNRKIRIAK